MNSFKYSLAYIIPIVVGASLYFRGVWSFSALIILFGLLPFLELFIGTSQKNLNNKEEEHFGQQKIFDFILYGLVPFHLLLLYYFLNIISYNQLPTYEYVGCITAFGMSCGLAINNAHELGHRSSFIDIMLSKILLASSLYMHFYIEHNRGHHKRVATREDPASSRYGESLYAFFIRSISFGWISAWKLEMSRMKKEKKSFLSIRNEMLQFQIIQLSILILIYAFFGFSTLVAFVFAALIGILMLETVNYIEHYGLSRKRKGNRYEQTLPIHSWNSNHLLGRFILLELSRHSDHHYQTNRKYQILRHFEESPQMPTGYPGMMLIATLPPLWFYIMHKRIDYYKSLEFGKALS